MGVIRADEGFGGLVFDRAREGMPGGALPAKGSTGDPFLTGVSNELADKGFLVTTTDDSSTGRGPAR